MGMSKYCVDYLFWDFVEIFQFDGGSSMVKHVGFILKIWVDSFPGGVEVEEGASGGFLYRPHLVYSVPHDP